MNADRATRHDFDFLIGAWHVRHRRLRKRLANDQRWEEFGGTMRARLILEGHGNFDENVIDLPGGRDQACTLRLHDPLTGRWSIHWVDGRDPKLDPPLHGSFADGIGTFYGDDHFEGRPVKVRFLWTHAQGAGPHWEQAFSLDGGASWETNWTMDFVKTDEP